MSTSDLCIAVCAAADPGPEALAEQIRGGGAGEVLVVRGADPEALTAARDRAHAYVLDGGGADDGGDRLVAALAARPSGVPLIVVGSDPAQRARPTLWLPVAPAASRLVRQIAELVDGGVEPAVATPSWRRKTDVIVGDSPAIREMLHVLDRLAAAHMPVLITGESGTGKELVARALHYAGPRARAPFVAINCAAIPDTLFEAELFGYRRGAFTGAVHSYPGAIETAHRGTLFLDELGELPPAMQAKLLRVLETGEVQRLGQAESKAIDFRLVTATNRDLEQAVAAGRFRADLYYRVHVCPLHVPALRDRAEDIPRLVQHQLALLAARERRPVLRVSPAALDKLIGYRWPGNVRELVNLVERAALFAGADVIDAEHVALPARAAPARAAEPTVPYREAKARFELDYYSQLMRTAGGNVSLAAKLGKKTRKEIYDALRRCGLETLRNPAAPRGRRA
ncbi:MAG TPA: sigma 54-interacting transcriptional regulator [Kofleriaceae bacterium]